VRRNSRPAPAFGRMGRPGIRRSRRLLAVAGLGCLATGVLLLPAAARPAAAAASPAPTATSPSPTATSPSPAAAPSSPTAAPSAPATGSPVTVKGPHMWDPKHKRKFPFASTVTVNETRDLVNQMVHVSWRGFTPSSTVVYDATATDYPVMVAECKGSHPTRWSQCYGADNGGVQGAFGPFGPMNTVYTTTAPNGASQVDIQILTTQENQFLGCDQNHACSLVVVPAQGGNVFVSPPKCSDHSQDTQASDIGQVAFSKSLGSCSWKDRIIIPLRFAPTPNGCPLRNANFTVTGSPMLARAMDQWRAGLCRGASPLSIQYNSALPEPLAVSDVQHGLSDVAFTTRPGPGGKGKFRYAPVAISAVSIAYWIDSPVTGQPVRNLKLDQRLVLKLLTQSYNFQNEGCAAGKKPPKKIGCDGAADGNPTTLYTDPEFEQLNPKVKPVVGYGAAFQIPTVQSGHSDMTWTVTRWIAANHAANSFLHGTFDPWGEHVNTNYLGLNYPVDSFTGEDSYPVIAHKYSPVFPLSLAASYQAENWDPGTDWEKDQFGNFPKDPIQVPGERGLIAVLDQADAAAYRFPVAAIRNAAGRYVQPSNASMAAATAVMTATGGNHVTRQVNLHKKDPAAYPLTMVIYAMVPARGLPHARATAIARFLDFAAGAGQTTGTAPGQLPPGYLPLPAALRAQTLKVATEVAKETGTRLAPIPAPSLSTSASASPAPSLSLPAVNPSAAGNQRIIAVAVAHPQAAAFTRYALPVLLIVGGLAALAGSSALVAPAGGSIAARLRRIRQAGLAWRRPAWRHPAWRHPARRGRPGRGPAWPRSAWRRKP
jgi:hypothetical protein